MNFIRYKTIIGLLAASSLALTPVTQAYTPAFIDHAANIYLSTFQVINNNQIEQKKEKSFHQQSIKDHFREIMASRELGLQELNLRDMIAIEFNHAQKSSEAGSVIDTNFIDKMEILKNLDETKSKNHLIHYLTQSNKGEPYLQTAMGHKRLVEMIAQPVTDLNIIEKRQQIIQELVNNDELRTRCHTILKKMQKVEPLFYDLHMTKELRELEKTLYFGTVLGKLGLNRPLPLSVSTRFMQVTRIIGVLSAPILMGIAIKMTPQTIENIRNPKGKDYSEQQTTKILSIFQLFGLTYGGFLSPILTILSASAIKQEANAILNMQERLIGASSYLTSVNNLANTLSKNSIINQHMPELKQVLHEFADGIQKSSDFNKLNTLLAKSTFDKSKPSVLSSPGNILMAYKHFMKESVRFEYGDIKNILGELDVYVALAQKIKEHQNSNAPFCFVQFVPTSDKPVINAVDFWNPFIHADNVVCNSIGLNTGNERNMILTGPNTGGKSTTMKALMISALLAQTFGIAPAKELTMTIFSKFLSYLNISDDTAGGISLFKAEVKRAQELMNTLRSLPENEYAFVIIDEIFTGTAPEKAEELSYKFIKQTSEFKNCLFIDATHFKKLVDLEKETDGVCKNYHTGVVIDPDNPAKVKEYTYTLTPGPSPINNAQQVADEAGVFDF